MTNREIDALIAEKVMLWERWSHKDLYDNNQSCLLYPPDSGLSDDLKDWRRCGQDVTLFFGSDVTLPNYSTDISAAWEAVNHLLSTHEGLVFHTMSPTPDRADWYAGFGVQPPTNEVHFANAGTPEVAICLAALKCVEAEVEADSHPRPPAPGIPRG